MVTYHEVEPNGSHDVGNGQSERVRVAEGGPVWKALRSQRGAGGEKERRGERRRERRGERRGQWNGSTARRGAFHS